MLHLRKRLGSFLRLRSLHCDLNDAGVDAASVVANIVKSELFCNLGSDVLGELLEIMDLRRVRSGTVLIRQGDRNDLFFVLARGSAVVTHIDEGQKDERVLAELHEPTGFCAEALLAGHISSITVRMKSAGVILRIKRDTFADFVSEKVVKWIDADDDFDSSGGVVRIMVGNDRRRFERGGTPLIPLCDLRKRSQGFDRESRILCLSHDKRECAVAAFFLIQRGFNAVAVRAGRNAVLD
jgi:CRP-like cAMP-binding protein